MPPKPGNKNALKHGLYAWHYTPTEKTGLKEMPEDDYLIELMTIRSTAAELHIAFKAF